MKTPDKEEQLSLDLGTEVVDAVTKARGYAANANWSGTSHYVTQDLKGRYWFKTRTYNYDIEWDTWFEIPSLDAAMAIVEAGIGYWHSSVDRDLVDLHTFYRRMKK